MLVTHSLGSYPTFSALDDIDSTEKTAAAEQAKSDLNENIEANFACGLRCESNAVAGVGEPRRAKRKKIATHLQGLGKDPVRVSEVASGYPAGL